MNNDNHAHIEYDEMKLITETDYRRVTPEISRQIIEIDRKTRTCSECRKRYSFFMDTARFLGSTKPLEMPAAAAMMSELEEYRKSMNRTTRRKIKNWIEGTHELIDAVVRPTFRSSLGSVRGDGNQASRVVRAEYGEYGAYHFTIDESGTYTVEIDRASSRSDSVMAIIISKNTADYCRVFDLEALSEYATILAAGGIELEKNEYTLYLLKEDR